MDAAEYEWLRRCAYWEGCSMSQTVRKALYAMVREQGYLRPPDDEPQDFGEEKQLMQWVVTIQEEAD